MEEKLNLRYQEYDANDDCIFAMTYNVPLGWAQTFVVDELGFDSLQDFIDTYNSDDSDDVYVYADQLGMISDEVFEVDLRDDEGKDAEDDGKDD